MKSQADTGVKPTRNHKCSTQDTASLHRAYLLPWAPQARARYGCISSLACKCTAFAMHALRTCCHGRHCCHSTHDYCVACLEATCLQHEAEGCEHHATQQAQYGAHPRPATGENEPCRTRENRSTHTHTHTHQTCCLCQVGPATLYA